MTIRRREFTRPTSDPPDTAPRSGIKSFRASHQYTNDCKNNNKFSDLLL